MASSRPFEFSPLGDAANGKTNDKGDSTPTVLRHNLFKPVAVCAVTVNCVILRKRQKPNKEPSRTGKMQEEAMLTLKWNTFSSQLTNSLDSCYEKQFFVDLSLVCKNGTTLKCHKMVLANASSFFHRLLVKNTHPHPMIILHDIEADDLKTIINFMYRGEIQVAKSEVKRILRVAEILEVSGLKDIRGELFPPEASYTSRESPGTPMSAEVTPKIVDAKSLAKVASDPGVTSASSFARRTPLAPKGFWNFSGRSSEVHAKSQASTSKPYENNANHHRTSNVKAHANIDKYSKRKSQPEEPVSWTKVLSQISKEAPVPLKRLCFMDEVEISASRPQIEAQTESFGSSGASMAVDPLDTNAVYVKQEIDADIEIEDNYEARFRMPEELESCTQPSMSGIPSLEVFKSIHCPGGVVAFNAKPVTLMEVLGRKDSS